MLHHDIWNYCQSTSKVCDQVLRVLEWACMHTSSWSGMPCSDERFRLEVKMQSVLAQLMNKPSGLFCEKPLVHAAGLSTDEHHAYLIYSSFDYVIFFHTCWCQVCMTGFAGIAYQFESCVARLSCCIGLPKLSAAGCNASMAPAI